ncbi:hypothetical protein E2F50_06630 [Rhizobium deserti]|uniref:Capsular biosynthesis protein n=1 Tax=Rhizobium deserti TaxID=2547961 RepID=A0A4R5UIQ1_9HYPH|nr:hypothetical protein [Rhizobium deserti]TDK36599.1 hypothetical protein E2F50_06630 [Rhizobium deserti]
MGSSLSTEFGEIPPAFLPVGNDCVFEVIAEDYRHHCDRIFMNLPLDYLVDEATQQLINKWKITIVYTSPDDTIARGIGSAMKSALQHLPDLGKHAEFIIVHGDTYVPTRAFDPDLKDFYVVSTPSVFHSWGVVDQTPAGGIRITRTSNPHLDSHVIVGVFGISQVQLFLKLLDKSSAWDWLAAMSAYINENGSKCVEVRDWMDFSFDASYYDSRRKVNAAREFNELWAEEEYLVKRSKDKFKMRCESSWFASLPADLSIYAPAVGRLVEAEETSSYRIEYLSLPSLAHILVFGRLRGFAWKNIFSSADRLLTRFTQHSDDKEAEGIDRNVLFDTLIRRKTFERMKTFCDQAGVPIDSEFWLNGSAYRSPRDLMDILLSRIAPPMADDIGIVHGDFCASNLMYDFSAHRLKVIDPRGYSLAGVASNYGDRRYEIAKLSHSIIGLYDFIIGGRFKLEVTSSDQVQKSYNFEIFRSPDVVDIQDAFISQTYGGYSPTGPGIYEMMATLFLSMLPLHADDPRRQTALLCNAYRVVDEWRPDLARQPDQLRAATRA